MYLKTVKLVGFKSFVDPTIVPVRSHMSAVVGPNGCGKSNIVDAIRWVIGESSAKQLRGQSMSDVIFNGTSSRKPLGQAAVELHFDNSSGRISGEYAKYTDLVIRRQVEREGQSSYFLNGGHCRRRDILDVFLGTGLGPRSYSIIEQGMISQMVEAKPDDMRAHLEEVAGISKYKERRRETENRIRHTQENLDRLNDLREELIKQLRHLKRQANAAERFQTFKEEERQLSAEIKVLHWQELQAKRADSDQQLREQTVALEEQIARQREQEAEIDKAKVAQTEAYAEQQSIQKQFYELGEEIARLEQQIKSHQDQIEHWQQELDDTENLWQELSESSFQHREQITELESELQDLTPQNNQLGATADKAREVLADAEARMQLWTENWDQFQQHASETQSQLDVADTKIEHQNESLSSLHQRRDERSQQLQALSIAEAKQSLQPLEQQLQQYEDQATSLTAEMQQSAQAMNAKRDHNKQQQQQLKEQAKAVQGLEAKHATVNALQQAALGYDDKTMTDWFNQQNLSSKSRLGQEIKVNTGWEKAVETVLSGYFDAVCVEQLDDYVTNMAHLADGRVTLLERSQMHEAKAANKAETLMSQIDSPWSFQQWLSGVYIAETVENASALRAELAWHESVITKDGVWIGKNWMRVSKIQDPQSGILEREQSLQSLTAEIEREKSALEQMEQQLKQGERELHELETERDQLQQQVQNTNNQLAESKSQLKVASARLEDLQQREQRLQQEISDCEQQITDIQTQLEIVVEARSITAASQSTLAERREQLQQERDQLREYLENTRKAAQQQQQQADELEIRLTANESQLALLRQTVARDEKQLTQLTTRRDFLAKQLSDGDSPVDALEQTLQQKLSARLQVEQTLQQADQQVSQVANRLKQAEQGKEQAQEMAAGIQATLEKLRINAQEYTVRQQTIIEQLQQTDETLETVTETLQPEANLTEWEERLAKITQRIERLGPINLAAIDEFESGTERKEYLDKQFEDLNESLETLQAAIRKIDRESKARFRETFDKVNEGFKAIFPQVFGGGSASLEMMENDLLKSGIMVRAQPPGKRNSTIHMLSGGEKALTAISLVFAMFQLNPAPFCILDEVDAPLDDLNVGRFCQLVKKMSKDTQFLIISHNKVTIEMADHLMGVTMQEPGVSRLVAVDMDEALNMVDA